MDASQATKDLKRVEEIYNLEIFFNELNYDLIKIDGARSVLTELRNRKSVISVMSLKYAGKMLLRPPGISNFFHRDAFTKWTFSFLFVSPKRRELENLITPLVVVPLSQFDVI